MKEGQTKKYNLEPNHTHFLLFDGESTNTDSLLLLRAAIEKYSRQIHLMSSVMGNGLIPIVMVLLEGGSFSIRTFCHALQSKTPLVVVKVRRTA